MTESIHPWNQPIWSALLRGHERRIHAWLLTGPTGVGKTTTALAFAAHLVSAQNQDADKARRLFRAGTHPDVHVLMPENLCSDAEGLLERYAARYLDPGTGKPKTVIGVEQVRRLIENLNKRSHGGGNKCVIITPAETMNPNSSNALLKILEEPPLQTLFVIVTDAPHRLPATVRSRACPVVFRPPPEDVAEAWLRNAGVPGDEASALLAAAGGAPIRAQRLHLTGFAGRRGRWLSDVLNLLEGREDPLAVVASVDKAEYPAAVDFLQRLMIDAVRLRCGDRHQRLYYPGSSNRLQDIGKRINVNRLFGFLDRLGQAKQWLDTPVDQDLMMEDLMIDLEGLGGNPQHRYGRR